ncbi:MAG: hypothetical protein HC836_39080 [Richelia sp. RM2_1_2]|nr:hypothetical protein [Richelia sp. RM2_1_2]
MMSLTGQNSFCVDDYNETLSKEVVFSKVSPESVFEKYLGELKIGSPILSPFRTEKHPSFIVGYYNGKLRYKDFATGESGDCIDLVQKLFQLSYSQALFKINKEVEESDFQSVSKQVPSQRQEKKHRNAADKIISIKQKEFSESELAYWKKYSISLKTLQLYNVYSAKFVYINKEPLLAATETNPIFAYEVNSKFKIYRPLTKDNGKWYSNLLVSDIFGYDQLDWSDDYCIITKGLKDVMVLRELGFNSIAPQAESQYSFLDNVTWLTLQKRFRKFLILFDCDRAGHTFSKRLAHHYNIPYTFINSNLCIFSKDSETPKDISDFINLNGFNSAYQLIREKLDIL